MSLLCQRQSIASMSRLPPENDLKAGFRNHRGMAKKNAREIPGDDETIRLYLGEWLVFLKVPQSKLADDTGFNEGYISQLVHREKENPSFYVVATIADSLGITVDELRRPPPSSDLIKAIQSLDPKLIDRIRQDAKKPRRP